MNTIWKYVLDTTDTQTIEMPSGAKVLTVQVQNGEPCIWALVNTDNKIEERTFRIYGTGHHMDYKYVDKETYIGSYQLSGGLLVFHLFEFTP